MSVLEPPIERLNYFNGERLEARDFRAEQEYFVRVRRLLNRSLYSPGIVKGLEVTKHPTDKHKVMVAPGLAFDSAGREIVLLDAQPVQVIGMPSTSPGIVLGNFLVISYTEQRGQPSGDSCQPSSKGCGCDLSWTGPTRIRSNVKIETVDSWPTEASGRIVLAQIELKQGCEVAAVHSGARKYAVAAKPPKVRGIALEGEKDIDSANPKRLFFHVDGGYPEAVTLVLQGAQFSNLYYTQIGRHTHTLDIVLADHPAVPSHEHTLGELVTSEDGVHSHTVTANVDEDDPSENAIYIDDSATTIDLSQVGLVVADSKAHSHKIAAGAKTDKAGGIGALAHTFTKKAALTFGPLPAASAGPAHSYPNDVHVWYDGADITAQILLQLAGRDPVSWPAGSKLGDGTQNHVFVKDGTNAINLSQIVTDIGPGKHKLEFKVAGGGGQIHYNLYVE